MSNKMGSYDRIMESDYDESSKVSKVTKAGKYGTFTAYSRLNPVDEDVESYWSGLSISEFKVDTMVQQKKAEVFRNRTEGAKMVMDYLDMAGIGADDPVYQKVARCVSLMSRDYANEYKKYRAYKSNLYNFVDHLHNEQREYNRRVEAHEKKKMENNE